MKPRQTSERSDKRPLTLLRFSSTLQCLEFGEGSVTGDMCEDLCVLGRVEYKRCLYYENGKKVIEARWRGNPIILKSKKENFSSYEPLAILDYEVASKLYPCEEDSKSSNLTRPSSRQDTGEELSALDVVFYATLEVSPHFEGNVCTEIKQLVSRVFVSCRYETLWGSTTRRRSTRNGKGETSALWPSFGGRS